MLWKFNNFNFILGAELMQDISEDNSPLLEYTAIKLNRILKCSPLKF